VPNSPLDLTVNIAAQRVLQPRCSLKVSAAQRYVQHSSRAAKTCTHCAAVKKPRRGPDRSCKQRLDCLIASTYASKILAKVLVRLVGQNTPPRSPHGDAIDLPLNEINCLARARAIPIIRVCQPLNERVHFVLNVVAKSGDGNPTLRNSGQRASGEQLIQNDAQRVDIALVRKHPQELLRGCIVACSTELPHEEHPPGRAGRTDTEIVQKRPSRRVEQDVARLDVEVEDVRRVQFSEPFCDIANKFQRPKRMPQHSPGTLKPISKAAPCHVLQDHERRAHIQIPRHHSHESIPRRPYLTQDLLLKRSNSPRIPRFSQDLRRIEEPRALHARKKNIRLSALANCMKKLENDVRVHDYLPKMREHG
jgi:hypothetical protein